ncbi:DNA cytosine methyltransferase [Halobacteriovorax sp. ZH2_bin.1]|uniref:DNA cytosine methyltransferase n=1 Tax=unclassified Halobacteriovorax TaxID=2639665 RepID=UPI003720B287
MKNTLNEVINTRIMNTKRGLRIWIEGITLERSGFERGVHYSLDASKNKIILSLNDFGNRKVSGKKTKYYDYPVIDLCGLWLNDFFSPNDMVMAKISDGQITIETHKEEVCKKKREEALLKDEVLHEASLCFGIGVSAHAVNKALRDANIKSATSLVMERESKYLRVASQNNSVLSRDTLVYQGDIESCDPSVLENVKAHILSISLPCTGHSSAGKAKNKIKNAEDHGSDATAIFGALKVIEAVNPSVIISENVVSAKNSATYSLFKAELKRKNYEIFEVILDEAQSDSLEKRRRYWFVAMSVNIAKGFSLENIYKFIPKKKNKTISDIIDYREDHNFFSPETFLKREEVNLKNGRNFRCNFVSDSDEYVGVIPRHYAKRQNSNPHYLDESTGLIRLFDENEHAKIKGIPVELVKNTPATTAHEGLGQSILYAHAYIITRAIAEHIKYIRSHYLNFELLAA